MEELMPRGDKSKYTDKEKRQAEHIEEGYESHGVSHEEAERRAWATVNKVHGGGESPAVADTESRRTTSRCEKAGAIPTSKPYSSSTALAMCR